jgi:hypothetical protein
VAGYPYACQTIKTAETLPGNVKMPRLGRNANPKEPHASSPKEARVDWLDPVGKTVGLAMSVLFVVLAIWYLVSGTAAVALRGQQEVFYALMIILGGPIPYFFVGNATALSLKTPLGAFTVAGGYVVAIFACYFVTNLMTEREVWRRFALDNIEQRIESNRIQIWMESNAAELHKEEMEPNKPFHFMCFFHGNDAQAVVTIQIPDPVVGFRFIKQPLLRGGERSQTIEIYQHAESSKGASASSNDNTRKPL